jgi:hypothetical protein
MSSLLTNLKVNSDGYLYIPYSEDFNFGSGDFTIEFWVKFNSWSDAKSILTKGWPASGADSFLIYTQDGSKVVFYASSNGSGWQISSAQNIINNVSLNKWYHIAVTRSGSTFRTFSNGVQTASWNNGDAIFNNTSHGIAIGNSENGNHPVDCNIDGLRITKGVCRYTSNFNLPINDTSLVTESAFKDRSRFSKRVLNTYTNTDKNIKQFGDSSAYFNGSSYLSVPGDKAWQLGTDDFTVEAWINPDTVTNTRSIAGNYDGADGGWRLAVGSPIIGGTPTYGPEVTFTATNDGSEVDVIISGVLEITRNNQNGIYNSALESSYNYDVSPANTAWNRCQVYSTCGGSYVYCPQDSNNWDNVCNYASRDYGVWRNYAVLRDCNGSGAISSMIGKELIMKHVPTNRYWAIKFTSWQTGAQGGAFSYVRKEILSCTVDTSVIQFRNGNSTVIEKSITPPLASGTWYHLAATRNNNNFRLFLDGNEIGSSTAINDNISRVNSNGITIGASRSSSGSVTNTYQGYIDDLRITKGTARYSANFPRPAAPAPNLGLGPIAPSGPSGLAVTERDSIFKVSLTPPTSDGRSPITAYNFQYSEDGSTWNNTSVVSDPYYDKVSLLLPMTGPNNSTNIVDDSKHNHNVGLVGNVKIVSSESWFGNGSVVFDGTNDNLVINNNSVFDLTNQDWTIEAWIRPTGNWSKYNNIITKRGNGGSEGTECDFQLYLGINSGVLGFYNESVGVKESSVTPLANIWNHVAAVRNGSTITLYLNGISVLSFVANALYNTNRKVYVGGWPAANNGSDYFYGNMNDVRVTKGVARYTSNFDPRNLIQAPANRITGLSTLGTPYSFRARSVNSVGSSDYSSSTTSVISALGAPSNLHVITDDDRAFISWTAPTANNSAIKDYAIQYKPDGESTWTNYAHTPSIDTSIMVSGLLAGTSYSFQVAAINIAGTGSYVSTTSSVLTALRQDNTYNKTRLLLHLDSN